MNLSADFGIKGYCAPLFIPQPTQGVSSMTINRDVALHSENTPPAAEACRRCCPVCGGELIDIKLKTVCSRCHTICETCCEGGRG
ncbi:hypothetical protein [Polystyrenella longa]|uniref:hypothetical protein n=1 Tax=Polystyrenella longa TaxID=2528007 RepID=UPI00119CA25E|nr:hypothetical protein [Polystyrenella longa]